MNDDSKSFEELKKRLEELGDRKLESDVTPKSMISVLFVLLSIPFFIVLSGLVIKMLWGWFVVPFGIQPIGIAHALGLGVLCNYLTDRGHNEMRARPDALQVAYIIGIGKASTVLGLAWIIHLFM